jgi:Flp pilus assembly protein TadD
MERMPEALHRIAVHLKQRRFDQAQAALAALPADLAGDPRVHFLQIELLRKQGRADDAAAYASLYQDWDGFDEPLARAGVAALADAGRGSIALDLAAHAARHVPTDKVLRLRDRLARQELDSILDDFDRGQTDALARLTGPMLEDEKHQRMALRRIVMRARKTDDLVPLADALGHLVRARPEGVKERLQLAAVLRKLKRTDEAARIVEGFPESAAGQREVVVERLRAALGAQQFEKAADLAHALSRRNALEDYERALCHTALLKAGEIEAAAAMTDALDPAEAGPAMALASARAAFDAGDLDEARRRLDPLLADDPSDPRAQALAAMIDVRLMDREKAERRLRDALAENPDDLAVRARLAEVLIARGAADEVVKLVERPAKERPEQRLLSILAARAERMRGNYEAAADHYDRALETAPEDVTLLRQTASANSQAGREDRAGTLLSQSVAKREARMPDSFAHGIADLENRVDEVDLPPGRLDWAWQFYPRKGAVSREEWERRAKWGVLADQLLFDWIEVRTDRADEAMGHFTGLDDFEAAINDLKSSGGGKSPLLTTAHVGPLFGGALALELLGVKAKWLASTPSVGDDLYQDMLISTSDQTETQVARATARALADGYAVGMAVDGAPNMNAPRTEFEGREVTFSNFAARIAYKQGLGSCYAAPRWEGGWKDGTGGDRQLRMHVHVLPLAQAGEGLEAYVDRWTDAWFDALRTELAGEPENLRLSGGIWRHIA